MSRPTTGFWLSQTFGLTLTYLALIMAMSISFSMILYGVSTQQLDDQLSISKYMDNTGGVGPVPEIERYLQDRIDVSKRNLIMNVIVLNSVMLIFGSAISFLLARRTLAPIESNIEAQEQFISDASHELRTPLTSLRLTNEVAARDKGLTLKGAKEIIASNLEEVIRLQNLSNLMLGFLTTDQLAEQKESVSLQDIVQKSIQVVGPQASDKAITIKYDRGDPLAVYVNRELITQAVVAVLDNAIKYSPEKSTISLKHLQSKKQATLVVADQGPGIDKKERDDIFRRFYRTSQARTRSEKSGFGLGLSIVKQIVEAHDGRVEVKSDNGGAVFSLSVPKE